MKRLLETEPRRGEGRGLIDAARDSRWAQSITSKGQVAKRERTQLYRTPKTGGSPEYAIFALSKAADSMQHKEKNKLISDRPLDWLRRRPYPFAWPSPSAIQHPVVLVANLGRLVRLAVKPEIERPDVELLFETRRRERVWQRPLGWGGGANVVVACWKVAEAGRTGQCCEVIQGEGNEANGKQRCEEPQRICWRGAGVGVHGLWSLMGNVDPTKPGIEGKEKGRRVTAAPECRTFFDAKHASLGPGLWASPFVCSRQFSVYSKESRREDIGVRL